MYMNMYLFMYLFIIIFVPKTSVAVGVLTALVEDKIMLTGQNLCAGTGFSGLQRGFPWPPRGLQEASRGRLLCAPVVSRVASRSR